MKHAPLPPLPMPLFGSERVLATVALSLATFMNVLDSTIANVSLPAIAGDMGVSPNQGTWVITSFAVSNAIAVPLTGWLAQRFGQVKLFVASILLFVLTSLACGLATSLPMLIGFRVLQGLVAGPMIPLSQALLMRCYPKEKSAMALAAWSMTTLVAPVMGPILGGWLTDNLSWPWIFYINIPVGLGAAWATWSILHRRESTTRQVPVDYVGLGLLVLWVGALQIMLDKGRELDWFASGEIIGLAAVAFMSFCFFLVWELHDDHPIVDLHLFQRRNFSVGVLTMALGYGLFFGNVVLMPLWLQQYMGYTSTWAGLVTAPIGFFAILLTPVVGKIMPKTDPRRLATVAFLVFATVCFLRSGFSNEADVYTIVVPQVVQGIAMATFFVPLTALSLSGLPPERIPSASGMANFVRITFGAFGASISTTVWDDRSALHHARLMEHISPFDPAVQASLSATQGAGLDAAQSLAFMERQVTVQSHTMGANDFFWISGVLFLILMALVWLARPEKAGKPVDAGGAH